jgi:hypothetical protein
VRNDLGAIAEVARMVGFIESRSRGVARHGND